MPTRALFYAGIIALLIGIFLFWSLPVFLRFVEIYPLNYENLAAVLFWFSVSVAGAGGLLLWRAAIRTLPPRWQSNQCLRMFPSIAPRNVLPWHRHRPTPLIAQLPNFGLVYGAILWILIVLFMILGEPHDYYGLPIELRTHDSVIWEKCPCPETLSIYLAVGEKYYINGRAVPREALHATLQQELSRRMVWTVYFEADYDTLNMDAIYAMDTIQALGAKLVWITPKVREELQQRDQSARQRVN